jgi:hypothetical protein
VQSLRAPMPSSRRRAPSSTCAEHPDEGDEDRHRACISRFTRDEDRATASVARCWHCIGRRSIVRGGVGRRESRVAWLTGIRAAVLPRIRGSRFGEASIARRHLVDADMEGRIARMLALGRVRATARRTAAAVRAVVVVRQVAVVADLTQREAIVPADGHAHAWCTAASEAQLSAACRRASIARRGVAVIAHLSDVERSVPAGRRAGIPPAWADPSRLDPTGGRATVAVVSVPLVTFFCARLEAITAERAAVAWCTRAAVSVLHATTRRAAIARIGVSVVARLVRVDGSVTATGAAHRGASGRPRAGVTRLDPAGRIASVVRCGVAVVALLSRTDRAVSARLDTGLPRKGAGPSGLEQTRVAAARGDRKGVIALFARIEDPVATRRDALGGCARTGEPRHDATCRCTTVVGKARSVVALLARIDDAIPTRRHARLAEDWTREPRLDRAGRAASVLVGRVGVVTLLADVQNTIAASRAGQRLGCARERERRRWRRHIAGGKDAREERERDSSRQEAITEQRVTSNERGANDRTRRLRVQPAETDSCVGTASISRCAARRGHLSKNTAGLCVCLLAPTGDGANSLRPAHPRTELRCRALPRRAPQCSRWRSHRSDRACHGTCAKTLRSARRRAGLAEVSLPRGFVASPVFIASLASPS